MTRFYRCRMGTAEDLRDLGPLVVGQLAPDDSAPRPGAPATVHLLIDTGAAVSGLDRDVARGLGLAARGAVAIVSVTGHAEHAPRFEADLSLWFEGDGPPRLARIPLQLVGLAPAPGGRYQGILGRDFLEGMELSYLGPEGRFELTLR